MNHKQLLNRAYDRLIEIYGGDQTFVEVGFLNRFYQEKKIENNYGICYTKKWYH